MADRYVETTHQGYFSRLLGSLMGVLIGFLLIPVSIMLLSWNEYRTIHRTRGLLEAEQVVEEVVDPLEVLTEHNDKLIHVIGPATTDEKLSDSEFGVERVALRLEREVEMYQWTERKEKRTRDKLGGGKETITTYEYQKKWEPNRVDSQQFHEAASHENPKPRYASQIHNAHQARLGGYQLTSNQVETLNNWQEVPVTFEAVIEKLPEPERGRFARDGARIYWSAAGEHDPGQPPSQPALGDLRISFRSVDPTTLSVLAQQKAEHLGGYRTSNGEEIESIEVGEHTAQEMFAMLRGQNTAIAWVLRFAGWVLACVGFGLITGPFSTLGSIIPLLGRLVGMATFLVAVVLGSCVAIVTIAIAWLVVRPIMAIALLALVGLILYFTLRRRKPTYPPPAVLA